MRHIRTRIRDKRGVDYTEEQIRELASVKLERILDPKTVRSDLTEHYRRRRPIADLASSPKESIGAVPRDRPWPEPQAVSKLRPTPVSLDPMAANYAFEANTIYESQRGLVGKLIYLIRRLLNPLLKLFFNPNSIIHVLHMQSQINTAYAAHFDRIAKLFDPVARQFDGVADRFNEVVDQFGGVTHQFAVRDNVDTLSYEVLNNFVVEITKLGIEIKSLKMRVESLGSRLDFDERRARALEGVVQYRPGTTQSPGSADSTAEPAESGEAQKPTAGKGEDQRRRRRRRGRRRPASEPPAKSPAASVEAGGGGDSPEPPEASAPPHPRDDGDSDAPEQ